MLTKLEQEDSRGLESELKIFISDNNPKVVDETTRCMATKHGGLGVPNVNTFWKSLRMSWFRRAINSESTWYKLHCLEVSPFAFDTIKSNHEGLIKAKSKCTNPFWKEMYASLISCRLNVLLYFPQEYRYIPINGELHITDNGVLIRQDWSTLRNIDDIIDKNGNFRELDNIAEDRRPLEFGYKELKKTLTDFLDKYSSGRLGANGCKSGITSDSDRSYGPSTVQHTAPPPQIDFMKRA